MEFDYAKLAIDVFDELNIGRCVPSGLVTGLIGKLEYFQDNLYTSPGCDVPIETYEGAKAVFINSNHTL